MARRRDEEQHLVRGALGLTRGRPFLDAHPHEQGRLLLWGGGTDADNSPTEGVLAQYRAALHARSIWLLSAEGEPDVAAAVADLAGLTRTHVVVDVERFLAELVSRGLLAVDSPTL